MLRGITAVLSCLNAFFQRQLEAAKTENAENESMKEPLLGESDQVDLEANRHGADTIENTPELAESGAALLENQENQDTHETHEKLENLENQENQETHENLENQETHETHENQETQEKQETDETQENQGNKETHENQENQEIREHIDPGVMTRETAECTEEVHDVDHFEEGEKDVEKPSQEEVLPILEGEHFFESHMIEVQDGSVDHERIELNQESGNADGEICVLNQPKMDQEGFSEHLETEVSLPSEGLEQLEDSTVPSAAPELVEELIEKDETIMVLEAVRASSPTENCGDLLENEENTSHLQVPAVVDKEAIPTEMPEAECFEPGKPAQLCSAETEAGGTYTFAISTCILYTVVYLHTH